MLGENLDGPDAQEAHFSSPDLEASTAFEAGSTVTVNALGQSGKVRGREPGEDGKYYVELFDKNGAPQPVDTYSGAELSSLEAPSSSEATQMIFIPGAKVRVERHGYSQIGEVIKQTPDGHVEVNLPYNPAQPEENSKRGDVTQVLTFEPAELAAWQHPEQESEGGRHRA